ncbi:bifunctional nuclease family protein [PVC group bacterium]|nr:bifunctional nuclease family protein [PVC group bacterium]
MAVQMELSRILIREVTDAQIIELREIDGDRTFPIVVGKPEAYAIERSLKGIEPPRPQTHDLLALVITQLGGFVHQVLIDDLQDGTFYAKLILLQGGEDYAIDCRPSDAIAVGVAHRVPIFVEESVLNEVDRDIFENDEEEEGSDQFDWD